MRKLPARPDIDDDTITELQDRAALVLAEPAGKARNERARQLFDAARRALWFRPVIEALRGLCGNGELCMYCSSNEPSQVEHFRPLVVFPERSFDYNNYLWTCDICNRTFKGTKFPPDNYPGAALLNPLDDNVWDYFFISDELGVLVPRVDPVTVEPLPRAASTCEVVGIDRENVQIKRGRRYKALRREVQQYLDDLANNVKDVGVVSDLIRDCRSEPYQADVADYFLNGPGRLKEPFRSLLLAIGEPVA